LNFLRCPMLFSREDLWLCRCDGFLCHFLPFFLH
jgi:hypothetical protein